jgi:hypothetical protein
MMGLDTKLAIAGIGLAVVALVVAVPPFIQMLWGRPRISVRFTESMEGAGQCLLCVIHSYPVAKSLEAIGVKRDSTRVFVSFDIRKHGTKEIFASAFRARLIDIFSGDAGLSALLQPPLPVTFTVVSHTDGGAHAQSFAPSEGVTCALPPGEYLAEISVAWGTTVTKYSRSFTIGSMKETSHWTVREIS